MSNTVTFPSNLGQLIDQDGGYPHVRISTSQQGLELETINLYVPSGLTLSDGASYQGIDMGRITAAQMKKDGQKLSDADLEALGMKGLENVSDVFADFNAGAMLKQGIAINPNQEMAFESMNIRSFAMEWDMVPESTADAVNINKIANFFRKYMYPKRKGAFALEYPPLFRIQFYVGEEESVFLPVFYDSYLTELSVNFGKQEGGMIYLKSDESGLPADDYIGTNMGISVTFQESKMLTREDIFKDGLNQYQNDSRPPFPTRTSTNTEGGSE